MEKVRVVHTFRKNPEEEVRLTLREYKDRQYLDLRLWFQASGGGEYYPTKKGLTLSMEHLGELKKGLDRAGKAALELPRQEPLSPVK